MGGRGGSGSEWGGGQGVCERRIEIFMFCENSKKKLGGGGVGGSGLGWGGQGGCERRIKVFVKIKNYFFFFFFFFGGGGGGRVRGGVGFGVRVDVNREVKFL